MLAGRGAVALDERIEQPNHRQLLRRRSTRSALGSLRHRRVALDVALVSGDEPATLVVEQRVSENVELRRAAQQLGPHRPSALPAG
jgi:hypothetical protein